MRAAAVAVCISLISAALLPACEPHDAHTDCKIDRGPCTKEIGEGLSVSFEIVPTPVKTMSNLVCRVVITKGAIPVDDTNVSVNFAMPHMVMAAHRVKLVGKDAGVYEGRCVIVRCPSGRKVWRAEIDIESPGNKRAAADFTFEVAK